MSERTVLQYGSPAKIPKDAIRLSEKEALEMQYKNVENWKPQRDMWPIKYGSMILAGSAMTVGMHANSKYRQFLKLKSYARWSTYLPATLLPALTTFAVHNALVTNDILLFKSPCAVCIQTRAVSWQVLCGTLYPLVLSTLSTLAFATQYKTYFVPNIFYNPRDLLHLTQTVMKRMSPTLYFIIAFNIFAATAITHLEIESVIKLGM